MKKMMVNLFGIMLVAGFICFSANSIKANELVSYVSNNAVETNFLPAPGEQDFILVNNTGVEIYALYVTPNNANDWGADVLGVDTLPSGEEVTIYFSPKERSTFWDLRVEDEDGNFIEWDKFNLKKISIIKLYYANGKATAIFE